MSGLEFKKEGPEGPRGSHDCYQRRDPRCQPPHPQSRRAYRMRGRSGFSIIAFAPKLRGRGRQPRGPFLRQTLQSKAVFQTYCCVQTFIVFMPVSASVFVLKVPLSTIVVVVVVGLVSTIVHFLVVASRTT